MKVTYTITMEYTTEVEITEDNQTIEDAIEFERECLEMYNEDLHCALDEAKFKSVQVKETV